jgi:hypothetical protein
MRMRAVKVSLIILGCFVAAFSQSTTELSEKSTLSGTVTDQMSAVIANATVKIRDNTGKEQVVLTNEYGIYNVQLNEGLYSLDFHATGFRNYAVAKYRIPFKGNIRLDVSLGVIDCADPAVNCDSVTGELIKGKSEIKRNKNSSKSRKNN